jgi:hypothetical protein
LFDPSATKDQLSQNVSPSIGDEIGDSITPTGVAGLDSGEPDDVQPVESRAVLSLKTEGDTVKGQSAQIAESGETPQAAKGEVEVVKR